MATLDDAKDFVRAAINDVDASSLRNDTLLERLIDRANKTVYAKVARYVPWALAVQSGEFSYPVDTYALAIRGATALNDSDFLKVTYIGEKATSATLSRTNPATSLKWVAAHLLDHVSVTGAVDDVKSPPRNSVRPVDGATYSIAGADLLMNPSSAQRHLFVLYINKCATVSSAAHELLSHSVTVASPLAESCEAVFYRAAELVAGALRQKNNVWGEMYREALEELVHAAQFTAEHEDGVEFRGR